MAFNKGHNSYWVLLTAVCFVLPVCLPSRPSPLLPRYSDMTLARAIEILHNLGIGIATDECSTDYLKSQDMLPQAYDTVLRHLISQSKQCNKTDRYRSSDGVCNNLRHPMWGAALQTQRRLLPNAYVDGRGVPRIIGHNYDYLTSARTVSLQCFPPNKETAPHLDTGTTQMVMQFGQYIDHDMMFTEVLDGSGCCNDPKNTNIHPDLLLGGPCFPIKIAPGDRFFTSSCMPFKRSFAIKVKGVREQVNGISSYIDATTVYGSTQQEQEALREHTEGLLKVSPGNQLPLQGSSKCIKNPSNEPCVGAGDTRVSVFQGLTMLHTVFHRNHNRLAKELALVNPHWDDETLYQEARKINIAIHQKIVYEDFVPILIGEEVMKIFGLRRPFRYNRDLDASIINSFGAAAFRYGHSQINHNLAINGTQFPISKLFFRSYIAMNDDVMAEIIKNQAKDLAQKTNEEFSTEVSDKLFFGVDAPGLSTDLAGRNIQRGRDHGIPSYLEYFDFCRKRMGYQPEVDQYYLPTCLRTDVYESVYDIDLFVGGLYEKPLDGALLGPTFACILAEQFWRLKFGDRFFYQTKNHQIGFTPEQLKEFETTSLTKVLCQNSEVSRLQPNVFRPVAKRTNCLRPCSRYNDINFEKWREQTE